MTRTTIGDRIVVSEAMIPVSMGELFDRISIAELKVRMIHDPKKNQHARGDYVRLVDALTKTLEEYGTTEEEIFSDPELQQLFADLSNTNESLWDIEEQLRAIEMGGEYRNLPPEWTSQEEQFGPEFVSLARRVYKTNDYRSFLKRSIDEYFMCDVHEVKSHSDPEIEDRDDD